VKSDVLVDFYCTLNRWDNLFCQLLNVHVSNGVRQAEIHTADPLVLEGSNVKFYDGC
jgi:hypothetical protein